MSSSSINIPQLLVVLLLTGLAIRYFFYSTERSPPSDAYRGSASSVRRSRAADPRQVEQIAQMFPQVGRREIIWDLQRNGGSVAATSERILAGVGLEAPPPSFQPPSLEDSTPSSSSGPMLANRPPQQDLISRYNLSSKISQAQALSHASGSSVGKRSAWSQNKNERQALLQRRREEMILNARRILEERDKKGS